MTTAQPPRLPIPEGYVLTLLLNQNGQQAVCVLGGKGNAGSWTDTDGAIVWRDAAWSALRMLCHSSTVLTGAVVRKPIPDGQVIEIGPPSTGAEGGRASSHAIASASALIKWTTAQGGRSGKGRTYLPGLTQDAVNGDGRTYTTAFAGFVKTQANLYLSNSALAAEGIAPAVLSYRKGAAYAITAAAPAPVVGTQRRRMR